MIGKVTMVVLAMILFIAGGLLPGVPFTVMASDTGIAHQHGGAEVNPSPSAAMSAGNAMAAGNKYCLVSGEAIDEKTKISYEYQGKIYNFCCQGCVSEFKQNPEKYLEKMTEEK